jgi:hypothetical protein
MTENTDIASTSSASAPVMVFTVEASPTAPVQTIEGAKPTKGQKALEAHKQEIANAIYWHIRAIRAMGRETVNTIEIAKALGLSHADVEFAISALEEKGVKVAA